MDDPALILVEEAQGNRGYVYHFDGEFSLPPVPLLFLVVLKGSLSCQIEGEEAMLSPGGMALWEGGESLAGMAKEAYCLLLFLSESAFIAPQGHISWRGGILKEEAKKKEILGILSNLLESQLSTADYAFLQSAYLWKALLFSLCTCFSSWEGARAVGKKKRLAPISAGKGSAFKEILQFLEERYEEKITLKGLAEQFFYTPSHLSKLFVRQLGVNFYAYLSSLRLSKALPLLLQTGMDIGVIADRVGFPNQRSFSQAFQKQYHMLPSEYRSAHVLLPSEETEENEAENLRKVKESGLLDMFLFSSPDVLQVEGYELADYGSFSIEGGEDLPISGKNNILTVDRARDLLLSSVQEMVRMLAGSFPYTYLTCHGFLANDLQIASVYRDAPAKGLIRKEEGEEKVRFDFSMYETIFRFVKSTGLFFIIQLGYTPSLLARPGEEVDPVHRSCICMPFSLEEWNRYIKELFTFLKERFGSYLDGCRVTLWQVPDVHVGRPGGITLEEYLLLYENTYRTVKEVVPGISFESPTISITKRGLSFQKLFLAYCKEKGCLPAALNYAHFYRASRSHSFVDPFIESAGFMEETENLLKSLGFSSMPGRGEGSLKTIPCNLLEYTYGFGANPICDSMAGASFPLHMTIENHALFRDFGYYSMCDFTTGKAGSELLFSGGHGFLTRSGTKKASYYAFSFLCQMGTLCLGKRGGLLLTRQGEKVKLLLYYDIPPGDWREELPLSMSFYEGYPLRKVLLELKDFEEEECYQKESILNHEAGSAYEAWLSSGEKLLGGLSQTPYDSFPKVRVQKIQVRDGRYAYQCLMQPFEIRLVEFFPCKGKAM